MWLRRLLPFAAKMAAQQAAEAAAEVRDAPSSADRTAEVLLCYALDLEAAPRLARLTGAARLQGDGFRLWLGRCDERPLAVCVSGMGAAAAGHAAAAAIAAHRPRWVLCVGLAGGLDESLVRGDVVFVDRVLQEGSPELAVDLRVSSESLAGSPGVSVGAVVTAEGLVAASADKKALGERTGAAVVDLETYAVAEACRAAGARFLAVRIVSDAASEDLPPEIARLAQKRSTAGQAGAAAGALFRRPSVAKDLWNLRSTGVELAERLDAFLDGVLAQLD